MKTKMRNGMASYLNLAQTAETANWALMSVGFTDLTENPTARVVSKQYVGDKNPASRVVGYDWTTAFTTDQIVDDEAVAFICNIGEMQLTGEECERQYVIVDLDKPVDGADNQYEARLFDVAIQVTGFPAADGMLTASGSLLALSTPKAVTFNVSTKAIVE